ncbi:hypothetical protein [Longispora albida]|uniref:hypothetical protein n=1 Tax=Longispora albida TaxID=203523 RepID=UPI0012FC7A9D|nr:hypothetical protein [Longispora albida]
MIAKRDLLAGCWLAGYAAVLVARPDGDLLLARGWWAAGLCLAAATSAFLLRYRAARPVAWTLVAALVFSCPLFLLDVVYGLIPGLGPEIDPLAAASRAACLIGAGLLARAAIQHARVHCAACSRRAVVRERRPRWAWWGAYGAIAACFVRIAAQVVVGWGEIPLEQGVALVVFEVGFVLAGTLLPLALVHDFGRVWPRWVPFLAGRKVQRWLVLGPAYALAGGITVYFTVVLGYLTVETVSGSFVADPFPLAFFWVAVPGYLAWGVGLGIAAIGYNLDTRQPCKACGRP